MFLQESTNTQEIAPIWTENPSNFGSIEGEETGTIGESKLPKTNLCEAEESRM